MYVVTPITVLLPAMASNNKRLASDVAAAAKRRRGKRNIPTVDEETELPPDASSSTYGDICTYCASNPAFDRQRVLRRHLFFLNTNMTKYVSVDLYSARDYLYPVEFGAKRSCGSMAIILTDEQVCTLPQCLLAFADPMCKDGKEVVPPTIWCESGNFRLGMHKRRHGLTRLYVGSEYMCLMSLDLQYLARMREYVVALPDLLPYVTVCLTSVVYVEPMSNASTHVNYPHLYEELV